MNPNPFSWCQKNFKLSMSICYNGYIARTTTTTLKNLGNIYRKSGLCIFQEKLDISLRNWTLAWGTGHYPEELDISLWNWTLYEELDISSRNWTVFWGNWTVAWRTGHYFDELDISLRNWTVARGTGHYLEEEELDISSRKWTLAWGTWH